MPASQFQSSPSQQSSTALDFGGSVHQHQEPVRQPEIEYGRDKQHDLGIRKYVNGQLVQPEILVEEEQQQELAAPVEQPEQVTPEQASDSSCYVRSLWDEFERIIHEAPPTLLPLEQKQQLGEFRAFLAKASQQSSDPQVLLQLQQAVVQFEADITAKALEAEAALGGVVEALGSTSVLDRLRRWFGSPKLNELLRSCAVSTDMPDLGSPAKDAVGSARRFLRGTWSDGRLKRTEQSVFSVHRSADKTVIHIGSGEHGSIFITLPHFLTPEELARLFMAEISRATQRFLPQPATLAVVDGDHQDINYQRIFSDGIVVRTVGYDCDKLQKNLATMLERSAPNCNNSALHVGFPATEVELNRVFRAGRADWDLWRGVAPLWSRRAVAGGFAAPASASSQQVLESLTTKENVIIVVAHGDNRTIYLPSPPPEGSQLTADEVLARKDEISANKPIVYLFCCETAEISNLKNFAQVLLESGAAAVVAPQTTIDAEISVNYFTSVVDRGVSTDTNSLTNAKEAQRKSKYREMEIWLG